MMSSQNPTLIALAILFLSLNLSFSHVSGRACSGRACPIVNDLCNRKNLVLIKDKCIKVFESDPRGANAPNNLTIFKIAMDQGIKKVMEAKKEFSLMAATKPALKTTLLSCVDHFKSVESTLTIYKRIVVNKSETDSTSLSYDFDLSKLDCYDCQDALKNAGVHDLALIQKADDIKDYFFIAYEITQVVTGYYQ